MSDSVQSLADIHFISEETIVPLLHKNYTEEKYYQKIGQIFCKINSSPNYEIEFQNTLFLNELQKWSKASNDKSLTDKQHIFKFAEEFRRFACDGNKSQCLMLRGISGSGKSDSVKKILQYLSYLDMSFHPEERIHRDFKKPFATYANPFYVTPDASMVSKRMAASITLLDSFYTAPTDHNNSSSLVSSHYKLRYTLNGKLSGFRVDPLFPEFVRCNPKDLYLGPLTIQTIVVNGLSSAALDQHLIPSSLREHYPPLPDFDYAQQLEHLREVVTVYGGLSSDVWDAAIKVIAAVINLQGITLLGTESAIISSSTKSFIGQAEQLLGVESGGLGPAVLKKPDERIGRPAGSVVECKPLEAKYLIEILCAEIMHRLTSFLLNQMSYNYPLTTEKEESPSENHIYSTFHILDPISWDRNCLNQHSSLTTLMNHYCEEKFGELYLVKAFQEEFERYGREGITIEAVTLPEWNIQIDIIERHAGGLIQLLEEACQNPRSEDKSVADKIILNHNKSKLVKSGGAKTKQTVFVIKHSFADISYDCDGFINANKYGQVPPSMSNALKTSKFPFISSEPISPIKLLDAKDGGAAAKVAKPRGDPKGVSPQSYAFYRTKQQIEGLISELQECEKTHYLVCLNLNPFSRQGETPPTDYLSTQIKSLYLEGLIKLAQSGFAYSRPYHDIYRRFRILLPFSNTALPLHITAEVENNYLGFCKNLLKECVMTHKLNQIDPTWETQITYGKNAIFMKEKFAMMLESYRFNYYESSNLSCLLLQSIIRMRKWRKSFLILRRGMIGLQSHLRRKIQRKRYLFNLQSALLVKSLIIVNYRRKRFLRMSKAANIIKKRLLGKAIQRIRYKRLLRAAKSFHALAKGFIVRRHSQNVYDSIRLIQRMAKAYVLRKRIARIRLASALRIQYIFRGYRVRQEHSSFVKVLKVRKEQRIAQRVVEKIQSLWRKKLVMERFQEIVESVVMIQRWLKTCMRRKWFLQLRELVICLQSQWRRLTSSKYVNALKVANMVKQEKESLSDLYYHETSCLKDIYWENGCILSEENRQEKKAAQRIMKLLVCLDFCFDLSLAYNDGWLNTYLTFQRELKNKENRHIKLVNIGNHHTVIVDDKSAVYTMGLGDLGQLGHGHRKSLSYPKKIEKLKSIVTAGYGVVQSLEVKTEIVSVACGKDHTLILTSGGLVFSWGDNRHGQLGHSNFESTAIAKVVVTASDQKPLKNVTQISCGSFHSACIADPGLLYTWGKGELLGTSPHFRHEDEYDTKMSDSCSPSQLPIFHRKKFTQVVCGESHIIALCYGEIYSWGMNQYGQLGLGNTNHQYLPKKIQTIRFHEFDTIHGKLYSGGRHNLFALKGNIWLWGWNKYGQIGDGTTDNALVPVQIDPTKLISKQLPVATTPTALSATASPSLSVARKMFVREDSRGETSLKHTAAPSTNNKGSVLVTSAFLTWRQSMVVTNNKEIFTWGVVNNLLPYTRSMREADEFLANNLPEPFEIMVKPKLLSLDGVSTHYFDGTDMKVSFNQQLVGVHGCSNFALSLLAVEVEAISSTNITQGTTGLNNSITTPIKSSIRANDATLSNSLSKLRVTTAAPTPTNTPGSTSKLKSHTVGLMATSAAAQARKEENDRKDKLKYKTVINKNTKFTKDITFDASSDEVLKRFREEVGRVTLYPGQKKNVTKPVNPKKNESEIPSEESKLNVHESNEGKDGTITKVPIKSTSLLDSVRSTRRVHITNDTQEGEGNDEESSRQPQKEDGSLVELFNPSLLKKMKSLKITQAERLKQLQKELHDQTSFDFTFHSAANTPGAPSSSPSRSRGSPTRSRGSKYEATGGGSSTSFLQNFLQGTEGATTSTSQWRKGESVSRRFSGSPLSRFVNSKAVTDAEDGPAPAASKKTAGVAIANGGRGTRDSFIWTAGSPTTSSRKARAGSLQGVESQPSQSSVDTTVLKSSDLFGSSATPSSHDKSKRMKLFSPSTSSLLANDPSNPNLSFKEQMHELGYLRKKTTPRFLFSENPSPLFNVDLNKVSQAQTSPPPSYNANPSTPGSGSPNKRDNLSKTGTTTGNTRNSLEKLKRELIYMQQK